MSGLRVRRGLSLSALIGFVLTAPAFAAHAPDSALRPVLRGTSPEATAPLVTRPIARPDAPQSEEAAEDTPTRPKTRPTGEIGPTRPEVRPKSAQEQATPPTEPSEPLAQSLHPTPRSSELAKAFLAELRKRAEQRRRGAVCGAIAIQGKEAGTIPGAKAGCGIQNAVRITSVSGVRLSQAALMDCTTAKALRRWVDQGAKPAIGTRGGGLSRLKVAAHYACRTRNSQPGAKLSEHGKGRAIDISGFTLKDGTEITLLKGWGTKRDGKTLRAMHRAACGPFGTVLGPESNRWHKDHFHFDTARYRSGSYCR